MKMAVPAAEPILTLIDRGVGGILGHDGGGLDHQVVQQGPVETGAEGLQNSL